MNVVIMYGGKSCEHDISVITAKQAAANMKNFAEVYVSREGKWLLAKNMPSPSDFADKEKIKRLPEVAFVPPYKTLWLKKGGKLKKIFDVDAALLCFHGVNGEDGRAQGLLELCGVPYTSCGVTASAVGMDKIVFKEFVKGLGLPVTKSAWTDKRKYQSNKVGVIDEISEALGYPAIVKPCNLGSSIGISVCGNDGELMRALDTAFEFDERAIVEQALKNFSDVNIAAVKKGGEILVSKAENPLTWHEYLSFEDKYSAGRKGMAESKRRFPFKCPMYGDMADAVTKIYSALDCKGVVRVDFLVTDDGFFVNEINTIPGSLAYYLWRDEFDMASLIKTLIDEAAADMKRRQDAVYGYKSDVLTKSFGKK